MKLVIQNTSRVWGGNEKWLATVAAGLMQRGHQVVVSCAMGPVQRELLSRGIPTSPFRPRGSLDFVSGLTFAAWLRGQRPDSLLLTSWRPTTWATVAARLAGIRRLVMRLGIVRTYPRHSPRAAALGRLDAVIVNSTEIRDRWKATAPPGYNAPVHVILNGVRSRIAEKEMLTRQLRDELGVGTGTILIGGAGHIAPRKGFDRLLRAFASADIPDSRLVIVGDGEHRIELERLAAELGVSARVTWLGHRSDGAGVIAGFDILVLSSHNEGMANVMLEAMAAGTPVVASDISGVREAVGPSGERPAAGWIVQQAGINAIAAAIQEVSRAVRRRDPIVTERTREALWRVENWFTPDRMVSECEAVLFPAG